MIQCIWGSNTAETLSLKEKEGKETADKVPDVGFWTIREWMAWF